MAQYSRPDADISDGGFTPSAGSDLYAVLDDNSDTDYITSTSAADDSCQVSAGTVTDPASSSGHVLRARLKRSKAVCQYNATVTLKQGATTIATLSVTTVDNAVTTYSYTLSGAEADAITDYSDLNFTLAADYVAGSGCTLLCYWIELEVPDVSGSTYNEATSLARSAGVSGVNVAGLVGAVSLGREVGVSEAGPLTLDAGVSLGRGLRIGRT